MRSKGELERETENNPNINIININNFNNNPKLKNVKMEKKEITIEINEKTSKNEKNSKSDDKNDHTIDEYSSAIFLNSTDDFDDATYDDSKELLEKESEEFENDHKKIRQMNTNEEMGYQKDYNMILIKNLSNYHMEYINCDFDSLIYHINPIFGNPEIHEILKKSRKNWDIPNNSIIDRLFKKRKSLTDIFSSTNLQQITKSKSREIIDEKAKEKENLHHLREIKNPLFHKFVPSFPKNFIEHNNNNNNHYNNHNNNHNHNNKLS